MCDGLVSGIVSGVGVMTVIHVRRSLALFLLSRGPPFLVFRCVSFYSTGVLMNDSIWRFCSDLCPRFVAGHWSRGWCVFTDPATGVESVVRVRYGAFCAFCGEQLSLDPDVVA